MTYFSEAEVQAIESSFPSTTMYLCDLHHEQSWERWVKDHHHGIAHSDQDTILTLLRNCATAPPAGIYDSLSRDHNYQKAVENLKKVPNYGRRIKSCGSGSMVLGSHYPRLVAVRVTVISLYVVL